MMRILAAVAMAVALAACAGEDRKDDPLEALVEFAREPNDETWSALPLEDHVRLGLGERLLERRARRDLRDPAAWEVDVELFRAGVGPFSALDPLSDADRPLQFGEGRYMRCASPPGPAPPDVEDLRRLSIRPRDWQSCLQWFAVDVFVTDGGEIAAVTLDYFEP